MSTYEIMRHFADSWGLVFMAAAWLGFCGWALRPGAKDRSRRAADILFRDRDNG